MLKHKVKAVLFDMDGVIVDSEYAWFHVFNDTLKCFGFKTVSKREFKRNFGAPIERDMKIYFKGKTIQEVKHAYHWYFRKSVPNVKLFPQSKIVLEKLRKSNIKIGLITNSTRLITLAVLNHFKLKKYFDARVTMDDVKRRKPAPDMILKACRLLKVNPKNTILIGDTKNDMIAGKRAGCVTVGYKIKGDYEIDSLNQIFNIFS